MRRPCGDRINIAATTGLAVVTGVDGHPRDLPFVFARPTPPLLDDCKVGLCRARWGALTQGQDRFILLRVASSRRWRSSTVIAFGAEHRDVLARVKQLGLLCVTGTDPEQGAEAAIAEGIVLGVPVADLAAALAES